MRSRDTDAAVADSRQAESWPKALSLLTSPRSQKARHFGPKLRDVDWRVNVVQGVLQ